METLPAINEAQHFFQVEFIARESQWRNIRASSISAGGDRRGQQRRRTHLPRRRGVCRWAYVLRPCCALLAVATARWITCRTEWIPSVTVESISDQGDRVFDALRDSTVYSRPLEAQWLAEASPMDLVGGLESVVSAYGRWISTAKSSE